MEGGEWWKVGGGGGLLATLSRCRILVVRVLRSWRCSLRKVAGVVLASAKVIELPGTIARVIAASASSDSVVVTSSS